MQNNAGVLKDLLQNPRAVILVQTAEAAQQIIGLAPVQCTLIATSPHAYFIFDNHGVRYQPAEQFGLDVRAAMAAIKQKFQPQQIGFFDDQLPGPQRNLFAEFLCANPDPQAVAFTGVIDLSQSVRPREGFRKWLLIRPRLYYLSKIRRTLGIGAMLRLRWYQLTAKPILLLNSGYCWDYCHQALYRRGYAIWGQVNLGLPGEGDVVKAIQLLNKKRFYAIVYSITSTNAAKMFVKAAREKGLPVIGFQHGDVNYVPGEQIVRDDLEHADLFLNWGIGSQENTAAAASKYSLSKLQKVVGSPYLDFLRRTLTPTAASTSKKIVYATTMYYLADSSSAHGTPWSDQRLYQIQRTVIANLAALDGRKLIKVHPSTRYHAKELLQFCESFSTRGVEVINNPKMRAVEAFAAGDILIIDTPSTTLLEAVIFNKPIFCILGQVKLSERALLLLKKRAVLSESPEQLMAAVTKYVKTGEYAADINNQEFLENFGTQLDGKAAERAVEEISKIIRNQ